MDGVCLNTEKAPNLSEVDGLGACFICVYFWQVCTKVCTLPADQLGKSSIQTGGGIGVLAIHVVAVGAICIHVAAVSDQSLELPFRQFLGGA